MLNERLRIAWVTVLVLAIFTGCKQKAVLVRVELPEEEIVHSEYRENLTPGCTIPYSPWFDEEICFFSPAEAGVDPLKVLHDRLISGLEKVGRDTASTSAEVEREELERAACSKGILKSCALETILKDLEITHARGEILGIITGSLAEFEPYGSFFRENYSPLDFSQFRHMMKNTLPRIEAELRRISEEADE